MTKEEFEKKHGCKCPFKNIASDKISERDYEINDYYLSNDPNFVKNVKRGEYRINNNTTAEIFWWLLLLGLILLIL